VAATPNHADGLFGDVMNLVLSASNVLEDLEEVSL
jgi:hypothetical protein